MAETMITFSAGLNDAKFGKIVTPLQAAILHESDLQAQRGGVKDWLYNTRKSTHFAETTQYQDELGVFTPTDEGASGAKDSFVETYRKEIQHGSFKKDVMITMEALQDAHYGLTADMTDKASTIVRAYYRTQHELAQRMIYNGALGSFVYNGRTYNPTTADGLSLFHKAHKYGTENSRVNGTQANYFYTAMAGTALAGEEVDDIITELATKIRGLKDESGNPLGYVLDTIVIPANTAKLEKLVKQCLGTPAEAHSSNNGINIHYGNYNLIIMPDWHVSDGTLPIIGMSSEANKNLNGSMFYDRMPLDIKMHEDESTRNLLINGACRFGIGHATYKHIVKCDIVAKGSSVEAAEAL